MEVLNIRYMIIRNNRTIFKTLLGYQLYSGSDLAITREDPGILESVCVCGGGGGLQGPRKGSSVRIYKHDKHL